MYRDLIATDLLLAERHVALGRKKIEDLQRVIAALEKGGQPSAGARELLQTFETMQQLHVAGRDLLTNKLKGMD